MKFKKNINLPLDKFINLSLYDKRFGYYMKKNPFGKKGDFITAPNISRLYPEMIAIWIISFWYNLGSPKNFNLIELGAGNGEMMKIMLESFKNFPNFLNSSKIFIFEKSPKLKKIQKEKLKKDKIIWLSNFNTIKKKPTLFIANEFFDSIAIKQFIKIDDVWFERFVSINNEEPFFFDKKFNMKSFEKKIKFKISNNQNFIEYSKLGLNYLDIISKIIKKNRGGLLIIDYGTFEQKMSNTLQAISNQKYSKILLDYLINSYPNRNNFLIHHKIIL